MGPKVAGEPREAWKLRGSLPKMRGGADRSLRPTGGAPEWGGQVGCLEEACPLGQLTMEARMGRKSVVVATLLVHSVKVATRRQRIKAMAGGDTLCSGVSFSPSHADRRDSCGQKRVV